MPDTSVSPVLMAPPLGRSDSVIPRNQLQTKFHLTQVPCTTI